MKKYLCLSLFLVCLGTVGFSNKLIDHASLPGQGYFTNPSGNVYMYVNIIGHVKNAGTHLVYEGADILTILSQAGGTLPGADLSDIRIYKEDNTVKKINLQKHINEGKAVIIDIKPNETIYISQKSISKILESSNIINSFISILNIIVTIILLI